MAESNNPEAKRAVSSPTFNDVTREVARRNEQAQKAARVKRTAREREQIAARRQWERL